MLIQKREGKGGVGCITSYRPEWMRRNRLLRCLRHDGYKVGKEKPYASCQFTCGGGKATETVYYLGRQWKIKEQRGERCKVAAVVIVAREVTEAEYDAWIRRKR